MCSMDKNRGTETKQLDDGIGDTLVLALSGSLEWPCSCLLGKLPHLGENDRQIFRDRRIAREISLQSQYAVRGKDLHPEDRGGVSIIASRCRTGKGDNANHCKKRNQQESDSFHFGRSLCGLPFCSF